MSSSRLTVAPKSASRDQDGDGRGNRQTDRHTEGERSPEGNGHHDVRDGGSPPCPHLWLLPAHMLRAMRPTYFGEVSAHRDLLDEVPFTAKRVGERRG
jgi:hypothetical protein